MPTSLFLYWHPGAGVGLDQVEDALADALGAGGDVTGSGTGRGSNVDVELADGADAFECLKRLDAVASQLGLPEAYWAWAYSDERIPVGQAGDPTEA